MNRADSTPRALVIRAAGTNCDAEMLRAFSLAGAAPDLLHVDRLIAEPGLLADYDILGFPGGFSYGDDVASGRVMAMRLRLHLYPALKDAAERGVPMIGVCNGFQTLVQVGLLPGPEASAGGHAIWPEGEPPAQSVVLTDNAGGRFIDDWARVEVNPASRCIWTRDLVPADFTAAVREDVLRLPLASGEGRFVAASTDVMQRLERNGQIALRYIDNFNGSTDRIAGICDASGLIFGLMPHPDRYLEWRLHPYWTRLDAGAKRGDPPGLRMFRNAVEYVQAIGQLSVESPLAHRSIPSVTPNEFCIRCSYDLRGLDPAGVCPECATPIAQTLPPYLLRFSDERYLRRLQQGSLLLMISMGSVIILPLSFIAVGIISHLFGTWAIGVEKILSSALIIAFLVLGLVSVWLLTARDQRDEGAEPAETARKVARLGMTSCACIFALGFAISPLIPSGLTFAGDLAIGVAIAGAAALAIALYAALFYIRRLAVRLPDRDQRRRITRLLLLSPLAVVSFGMRSNAPTTLTSVSWASLFGVALSLLGLYVFVAYIIAVESLRSAITRQLRWNAHQHAAAAVSPASNLQSPATLHPPPAD